MDRSSHNIQRCPHVPQGSAHHTCPQALRGYRYITKVSTPQVSSHYNSLHSEHFGIYTSRGVEFPFTTHTKGGNTVGGRVLCPSPQRPKTFSGCRWHPSWLFLIVHRWCGLKDPEGVGGGLGSRPICKSPRWHTSDSDEEYPDVWPKRPQLR